MAHVIWRVGASLNFKKEDRKDKKIMASLIL